MGPFIVANIANFFCSFGSAEPIADRVRVIVSGFKRLFDGKPFAYENVQVLSTLFLLSVIANIYLLRRQSAPLRIEDLEDVPTTKEESVVAPIPPQPTTVAQVANEPATAQSSPDNEILEMVKQGKIASHSLEKVLGTTSRAVGVRRQLIGASLHQDFNATGLPYEHYDYSKVFGVCCENVIGYVPLPLGVAGPFVIDGKEYFVPMATTEGCLIASTSRGCKAIGAGGGATTVLTNDGMTRGPVLEFPNVVRAAAYKNWLETTEANKENECGFKRVKEAFDSTSRFARLQKVLNILLLIWIYFYG